MALGVALSQLLLKTHHVVMRRSWYMIIVPNGMEVPDAPAVDAQTKAEAKIVHVAAWALCVSFFNISFCYVTEYFTNLILLINDHYLHIAPTPPRRARTLRQGRNRCERRAARAAHDRGAGLPPRHCQCPRLCPPRRAVLPQARLKTIVETEEKRTYVRSREGSVYENLCSHTTL